MFTQQPKSKKFKRLTNLIGQTLGKATAELEASRKPMEYIKKHKNMSIKNVKGVAF